MVWMRSVIVALTLLGAAGLSGCSRGIAEFQLYSQAFDAQYTQGEAILDRIAKAERTVVLRRIKAQVAAASVPAFVPEHAPYHVDGIEPPITGSIRASLKSLKAYNAALIALMNGEAADAFANRIGVLGGNVLSAATATTSALGGAGLFAGAPALLSKSSSALQAALPIVKQLTGIIARETFRRELVRTYPHMRELLIALREGTPAMFEILKRAQAQRGNVEQPYLGTGLDALAKDRVLLAAWVVLMDKTLLAMETAVIAILTDASAVDLVSLSEASVELRVLAEQIKTIRNR